MNLTHFSSKTEKRASRIDGRGLFTNESIAKGEVVVIKGGYVMTRAERDEAESRLGPAEIQITEDLYLGAIREDEREGCMIHLNHSCEPNLGVEGQIAFVALRDIEAGEELTCDYAMTDDEPYEMDCNCGAPNCRRVITGYDWKLADLQRKYDGYFSWYIQRRLPASP